MTPKTNPFSILFKFIAPHKLKFIKAIILALISVAAGISAYIIASEIIVNLLDGNRDFNFYAVLCGITAAVFLIKCLTAALSTSCAHRATFSVMSEFRRAICRKLAGLPMGYVIESPSGKLKGYIVERIEQLEVPLAHIIPETTTNIIAPLAILVYIAVLDFRIALAILVVFAVAIISFMIMMSTYPKYYQKVMEAGKHMGATMVEYINGIKVIKIFSRQTASYDKFTKAVNNNTDSILTWMRATQIYSAIMMSIMPAVLITVLPLGLILFANGEISAAKFIICVILSLSTVEPLLEAVFMTDELAKIGTICNELSNVLDQTEMVRGEKAGSPDSCSVQIKNVSFSYGETEVLHDISFSIEQGTTVAIVGESGSGKSTIAKLIASMWDVGSGEITVGNINIKELSFERLSDLISFVSQDNYLFNDTIRNNIRMGKHGASDKEVEEIAKAVGCDDFIRALPNGYETICGGTGSELSGGERQRITIARAMLKNAPIIILDEATSYTDPENEAVIQAAINKLTQNKTLIIIAHRLSTIIYADKIEVIDRGRLLAEGTQQTLLKTCEKYRDMWEAHIGSREDLA